MADIKYRTCNLCEAMCGLAIHVEDGRITAIRGDAQDVFSRGHICPKAPALREVLEDPDRLRYPVRRTKAGWRRATWREALDEAAEGLQTIRDRDGDDAVGVYLGNPIVHNHGAALAAQGFARTLHTKNRFDANSLDANPKLFACQLAYGDPFALTIPDVDRTQYLLMLGANPAASNGSLMTLGDVRGRLAGIRARGGKVVLIDPRRTETAAWADEHHFIRPGADAAFLLAVMHVLFKDDLVDRPAVEAVARGLGELERVASAWRPEHVAPAVGIDAVTIRRLAGELGRARAGIAYGRVGVCLNPFGGTASFLLEALNVLTGNFDRAGGMMFASPAVDLASLGRKLVGGGYARWRSRVRGLPELGGQLPAAVMAEEMETPGPGQIKGFVTVAGNPVLSAPNGERLAAALARLEHMVSVDFYINETTRHAHVILPPMHTLERGHYDVVFHALAVRNTAKWSEPVVAPDPDAHDEWWILNELGMRLGGTPTGSRILDGITRLAWQLGLGVTADQVIDLMLRFGPYGAGLLPFSHKLSLAALRRAPHGVDLGALVPSRKRRVRTPDGKVDLAPRAVLADVPRVERWLAQATSAEWVIIGRRHLRSNNSWMHNCASLVKGPDRTGLLMNRADAARRGFADGQAVRVTSRVGAGVACVSVTDDLMPGVVSLPHGFGHAAAADTLRIAGQTPGPSLNALTDDELVDPLTGTAMLNGVPVTIAPA